MSVLRNFSPFDQEGINFNARHKLRRRGVKPPLNINWIIPDINVGGGGHMTMFRLAQWFANKGHVNRFYINPSSYHQNSGIVESLVNTNFLPIKRATFFLNSNQLLPAEITFATDWYSAYRVFPINETLLKCYLIQDFEPDFFPKGSYYQFAINTYRMGYLGVCASSWLLDRVGGEGLNDGVFFNLGVDRANYFVNGAVVRDELRVAVYVRPNTPRRGFELLMEALSVLKESRPEIGIVFFGATYLPYEPAFHFLNLGIISAAELGDLYRSSSLVLLGSFTNYSLIPLEAMACGAAVMDLSTPCNLEVFSDGTPIVLVNADPNSIALGINDLLCNRGKIEALRQKGTEYVRRYDWEKELGKVGEAVLKKFLL